MKIYRIKTESRKSNTYFGCREWQYIKESLTFFTYCPIQDRFIVIGFRWAGNSTFGYSTEKDSIKWGIQSLCKQKEEFILLGGNQHL